MNKCSGCSRDFTSVTAFDRHRTGSFSKDTRRCMSEAEMSKAGLERKPNGKWSWTADIIEARIARFKSQAVKLAV